MTHFLCDTDICHMTPSVPYVTWLIPYAIEFILYTEVTPEIKVSAEKRWTDRFIAMCHMTHSWHVYVWAMYITSMCA